MIALLLALTLQDDPQTLVAIEARFVVTQANLRAWTEKAPKPWSPWEGVGAPDDADPSGIDALVKRLDSASIEERDDASRELVKIGRPALPLLKKALAGTSSETKARLEEVALRIIPRPDSEPRCTIIPENEREAFFKRFAGRNDVNFVDKPRLTGFAGQSMEVLALGGHLAYIRDWEMQVGPDSAAADPVIAVAKIGQSLNLKPSLREGRIRLECALELAEMKGGIQAVRTVQTPIGTIEDPEIQTLTYRMTPTLAAGELALIGPLRRPWTSKEEARMWVVLRAAAANSK